jgi:hypothetical protein
MPNLHRVDAPQDITGLDDITSPRTAGLVVYAPTDAAPVDVIAYAASTDAGLIAALASRTINGRTFKCAVFMKIGAGEYEVSVEGTALRTVVQLTAGQVMQLDWRRAAWPTTQTTSTTSS